MLASACLCLFSLDIWRSLKKRLLMNFYPLFSPSHVYFLQNLPATSEDMNIQTLNAPSLKIAHVFPREGGEEEDQKNQSTTIIMMMMMRKNVNLYK